MTVLAADEDYRYRPIFDPDRPAATAPASGDGGTARVAGASGGDQVPPGGYLFTPRVVLAVNVALATRRPLLVRGDAGSGKSSLAPSVAAHEDWDLYTRTISSRTTAQDLLWTFDALRRLHDAQARQPVVDLARYISPGVLWEALDPGGAAGQNARTTAGTGNRTGTGTTSAPGADEPKQRAVLLLDEIDKAEPDVPNDLLEPLGSFTFSVPELDGRPVENTRPLAPLVVLTTNGERELPPAFLRRCVVLTMPFPDDPLLVEIAVRHFGPDDRDLYAAVAGRVAAARRDAGRDRARAPGTAEYLDAIRACRELGIDVADGSPAWRDTWLSTVLKWAET